MSASASAAPKTSKPSPPTFTASSSSPTQIAYDVTAPVVPGEIAPAPSAKSPVAATTSNVTTLTAIGLAFLGGIILNRTSGDSIAMRA